MSIEDKINKLKLANESYYRSESAIMSDWEYDILKKEIEESGNYNELLNIKEVEGEQVNDMLSLHKVQVFDDCMSNEHIDSIINWFQKYDSSVNQNTLVDIAFKMDGNAIKLVLDQYYQIVDCITRGGFSVFDKIGNRAKEQCQDFINKICLERPYMKEVRCEVVMKKDIFVEKYINDYQNPRNLVSGIINDENPNDERLSDIDFVILNDGLNIITDTDSFYTSNCPIKDIIDVYNKINNSRNQKQYPTDGFVLYLQNVDHLEFTGKFPHHSLAVKFPPKLARTTITDIVWRLTKTGSYFPRAKFNPVDLDGSTVKFCSVFNYEWVMTNKVFPGAEVEIGKNGDIIPYIQKVIKEGDQSLLKLPEDENMYIDGVHLKSTDQCTINLKRFIAGCEVIGFYGFAKATYDQMGHLLNFDIVKIFDPEYKRHILDCIKGKKALNFEKELEKAKQNITLDKVIHFLQFKNCGETISQKMAEMYCDLNPDLGGIEKKVVSSFINGTNKSILTESLNRLNSYGINVIMPKKQVPSNNNSINFEMTGSPKDFGFSTKEEFIKFAQEKNYRHTKLDKECKVLFTDDINSNSSKMIKAKKLGVTIMLYKNIL